MEPLETTIEYHLAAESEFIIAYSRYIQSMRMEWRINERIFMFWADKEVI